MPKALHWFRNDLRLSDNPALNAAANWSGGDVHACFTISERQWKLHDVSPAKVNFIFDNLAHLESSLADLGIPFHVLYADYFEQAPKVLFKLAKQLHCQGIFFNQEHAVNETERDQLVQAEFNKAGLSVFSYQDQSILPLATIRTRLGTPYTVFTPFRNSWWQQFDRSPPTLWSSPQTNNQPISPKKRSWSLFQYKREKTLFCEPGETQAHITLNNFISENADKFKQNRDFPGVNGTSLLSPYLATGVLSGKQCVLTALAACANSKTTEGLSTWINELIWRDFYINILHEFPRVSCNRAFKPETESIPWINNNQDFQAWCLGQTGIPIVDAAMRQLNATGWMHNRLRMITAMFLSKNLLLDWRIGERYFMTKLIDGYLPSNNGGWQWSASTGTDAAPYFRIFNPMTQSEKFDKHGEFIRHWVPELRGLSDKQIHLPLKQGLLGVDYPLPIVDLKTSRQRAIDIFRGHLNKQS